MTTNATKQSVDIAGLKRQYDYAHQVYNDRLMDIREAFDKEMKIIYPLAVDAGIIEHGEQLTPEKFDAALASRL